MLDVAACAQRLFVVRPNARHTFAELLGIRERDAVALAVLIAAFHDLGKFAAAFQSKAEGPPWPFSRPHELVQAASQHDRDGLTLWQQDLSATLAPRIWRGADQTLRALMAASVGHHGRAVSVGSGSVAEIFQTEGMVAARNWAEQLLILLLPHPIVERVPRDSSVAAASFWLAGFVTIADWAGSSQKFFPYEGPQINVADYWCIAQRRAAAAVKELGLEAAVAAPVRSFVALTGRSDATPLQSLATSVDLGTGPTLVIVEDVTGAGKTEAAQILVNRLMASGRGAGAFWGMPTQATANAMYARQRDSLAALFVEGAQPQLVLSHGGARLHAGFQNSILRGASVAENSLGADEADETASAACAAFLADDARAALIAEIGAGTIDQAMLAVLPARFQAVRLFGLADKVLVVDEAHAYDAYMSEELRTLLQFQAALGGSAIVLSATLPMNVREKSGREQLVRAWMEGCGARLRDLRGKVIVQQSAYPLMTVVSGTAPLREYPVAAADWSHRRVPIRFVADDHDIVVALVGAARNGAAVAWIRNTVDDAIAGAQAIRQAGLTPIIFHARFAYIDRQAIEVEVMRRFGPQAADQDRRGRVVIATQVIEQSLDLDFDLLASDLAPVDLLIQRAGRLRRHRHRDTTRPSVPFEMIVRAPPFDASPETDWLESSMKGTSFVYQDPALLWRTMSVLRIHGAIETPGGLRALIEEVYGEHAVVPPGLDSKALKAEGIGKALAGRARQMLLRVSEGYRGEQMTWVSEDALQVSTRLGIAQTTVRLARSSEDGSLQPWSGGDMPLSARWALSEVKVGVKRAPPNSRPIASWQRAAAAARAKWGARERDRQDILILPLERVDGTWQGELTTPGGKHIWFQYSIESGLLPFRSGELVEGPAEGPA